MLGAPVCRTFSLVRVCIPTAVASVSNGLILKQINSEVETDRIDVQNTK